MLEKTFKSYLEELLSVEIIESTPLSGGDINDVYKLESKTTDFVIKVNVASRFPNMFELEKLGLEHIADSNSLPVPQVILTGTHQDQSFIVLEHIASSSKKNNFSEVFGEQLARMHKTTAAFGFEKDNYIGSLPQFNTQEENAVDFYINQRLIPQFKRAQDQGYSFKNIEDFYTVISKLIPEEPASLIHGDLWSGNYMVNNLGLPMLIDPATCYAPREMDIALMHLFGGFNTEIFDNYHKHFRWQKVGKID